EARAVAARSSEGVGEQDESRAVRNDFGNRRDDLSGRTADRSGAAETIGDRVACGRPGRTADPRNSGLGEGQAGPERVARRGATEARDQERYREDSEGPGNVGFCRFEANGGSDKRSGLAGYLHSWGQWRGENDKHRQACEPAAQARIE